LRAELTFYLAAPLLMRSWKIGAALLAVSFGLRAAFVNRARQRAARRLDLSFRRDDVRLLHARALDLSG
jgi:hypothetical protein